MGCNVKHVKKFVHLWWLTKNILVSLAKLFPLTVIWIFYISFFIIIITVLKVLNKFKTFNIKWVCMYNMLKLRSSLMWVVGLSTPPMPCGITCSLKWLSSSTSTSHQECVLYLTMQDLCVIKSEIHNIKINTMLIIIPIQIETITESQWCSYNRMQQILSFKKFDCFRIHLALTGSNAITVATTKKCNN